MPKPSSTSPPKRAANACSVSGGSGAPPTCVTRSFGTGAPASAARSSAMHMDGTPRNTSDPSRCIRASAASASKRGISAMQAPDDERRVEHPRETEDVAERRGAEQHVVLA